MTAILDRSDRPGLWLNIAAAVGLALICNAIVFDWGQTAERPIPAYAPPGSVVSIVWTLLFAGMGAARWLLLGRMTPLRFRHARLVVWLVVFCAAYTFTAWRRRAAFPASSAIS
jgi:tryptophan-rich sensory protein